MDESSVFDCLENFLHGITNRQNETGGKLSQFTPGVHKGWRVGQKLKGGHHGEKFIGKG